MEPEVKKPESTLLRVLSFTAEQTLRLADANTVLGDRFELDGTTVIPVSKVSAGFAGGGADVNDVGRKKRQNPAGAGAKITRTPMSFLVVKDGQVRVLTVQSEETEQSGKLLSSVAAQAKALFSKKK